MLDLSPLNKIKYVKKINIKLNNKNFFRTLFLNNKRKHKAINKGKSLDIKLPNTNSKPNKPLTLLILTM